MEETNERQNHSLSNFISKVCNLKYWPLLLALLVIIVCYISYFAFAIWQAVPSFELYQPNETYEVVQDLFYQTISFVQDFWLAWPIEIAMAVALSLVAVVAGYLLISKKMTWKKAIILLLFAGVIMRIGYGLYTDNITTRQHDVWRDETYTGHYGITMYIYYNWKTPFPLIIDGQYDLSASYQLYHPKFSHWTFALFMHFNSLFMGQNDFVLYQANRILTTFLSIMGLYLCYRLINETKLSEPAKFIALAIITFCPMFYRLAGMSNNDPFVIFFMIMAIYFTFRWMKNHSIFNIVFIAIAIGLAMSSKLSGALISVLTALIFLYVLIRCIMKKDTSIKISKLILQFAIFAGIVFPLGLFWPLYAFINYGQPFLYVWTSLSPSIGVPANVTWFNKYGYFDFYMYFHHPFIVLWKNSKDLPQDYNIYDTMLKSSLFGEFSYDSRLSALAYIMLSLNLLFGIIFVLSFVYLLSQYFVYKHHDHQKKEKHNYISDEILFMGILFILFFLNYLFFTMKNPYICSYDFRYIVPIVIPFGYFIGLGINSLIKINKKPIKFITYSLASLSMLLALSTCIFYCCIK